MVLPASTWPTETGSQARTGVQAHAFDPIPPEGHLLQDIIPGHQLLTPLRQYGIVDTADIAYEFGLTADYLDLQGRPSSAVCRAANFMPPTVPLDLAHFLQEVHRRLAVDKWAAPTSAMHTLSHHTQTLMKGVFRSPTASDKREMRPLPPPPPPASYQELNSFATPSAAVSRASTPSERSRDDVSGSVTSSSTGLPKDVTAAREPEIVQLPSLPPAAPMLSGLQALDDCFQGDLGLPPGRALEIIGPTASGKSRLGLQLLIQSRLAGLQLGRWRVKSQDQSGECDEEQENGSSRKDFDEVLIIDTEGSLTPDIIRNAVWQRIQSLKEKGLYSLSLFEDVLDGIHLIRPASLPELIATLRVLTSPPTSTLSPLALPTDLEEEKREEEEEEEEEEEGLPPLRNLSAILLDSLSFHLRTPVDSTSERRTRRYALSLLSLLPSRLSLLNPRVRLVLTNQMSLKMFSRAGQLVTYKAVGSIARMFPQVDLPGGAESGTRGWAGGGGETMGRDQDKGLGLLGEETQRLLLFRLGEKRMMHIIYMPPLHCNEDPEEAEEGKEDPSVPNPHQLPDPGRWIPFHLDTQGQVVGEEESSKR